MSYYDDDVVVASISKVRNKPAEESSTQDETIDIVGEQEEEIPEK
jgi:hypothetical protein